MRVENDIDHGVDPKTGRYPGEPAPEPSASDWAISELNNSIITLEKHGAIGYVSELKEYQKRLQAVIDKALKPF